MTEDDLVQAISVNLLRMAQWYYKDPEQSAVVCERYLQQSKQLSERVTNDTAKPYLIQLRSLTLSAQEQPAKMAERFLTLGVILQHPEKWMHTNRQA
jgi:hypothetical protein